MPLHTSTWGWTNLGVFDLNGEVTFGPFGKIGSLESLYSPGGGPSLCGDKKQTQNNYAININNHKRSSSLWSKKERYMELTEHCDINLPKSTHCAIVYSSTPTSDYKYLISHYSIPGE